MTIAGTEYVFELEVQYMDEEYHVIDFRGSFDTAADCMSYLSRINPSRTTFLRCELKQGQVFKGDE